MQEEDYYNYCNSNHRLIRDDNMIVDDTNINENEILEDTTNVITYKTKEGEHNFLRIKTVVKEKLKRIENNNKINYDKYDKKRNDYNIKDYESLKKAKILSLQEDLIMEKVEKT